MVELSGYSILQTLYVGEKNKIYRAKKGENTFILKTLKEEYPEIRDLENLKQEYEILNQLSKNNSGYLIKVIGIEKYQNKEMIILEDIGAESITNLLSEIKNFPLPEILNLFVSMAKALEEVHNQGLVHKDIKPQNIIFNKVTKKVQIIDFGNASLLTKQNSYTSLNSSLEGTLAYISPEKTGRMNRTVDYRTDYYSLGVTFYQILTGELPFISSDPMELVHAHIAKMPLSPFEKLSKYGELFKDRGLQPTAPKVISDIVMKLLQKNPEDRYQSITGLVYDLELCQSLETLHARSLRIGTHDFSGKFQIPEKLYGRKKEIQEIVETFKEVATGNFLDTHSRASLHLISGRSGIGKSALINEVNKPITEYKGYFASGKYDLFKRAIPYYAINLAFQNLIQQVLTSDQKEIFLWKENLLKSLGVNGQVIVDVIPELENLIGKQPEVSELGAAESQNRFNLVFQNFIQAVCTKEHPIAIFLDDMQWADNPSISLIQTILSNPEMKYLYLILSFRDNEVLPTDSFSLMLENLKKSGFIYKEILLEPIGISDITHLVMDTLHSEESKAKELAEILFEKTKGNPFFVNELFTSFYKDGLVYSKFGEGRDIVSNVSTERWNWDISKIRETKISENVIDLMVEKVQELTKSQIELLKLAACVGDSFSLDTFFQLANQNLEVVNRELTTISNEGFLILTKNQVRFVHDKVREATYSLIGEEERVNKHYAIGSNYLKIIKEEEVEGNVFAIVNQLNLAISLLNEDEKARLINLNILAGDRAFASSAYFAALEFYRISKSLLLNDSWKNSYELVLNIYTNLGRLEYLTGNYENAEKYFELILERANTILEKISVYQTKIELNISRGQLREALSIGIKALEVLGVRFPEVHDPTSELEKIFLIMENRKVEDILETPLSFEPNQFAIMQLLASSLTPAYISYPSFLPLIVMKMVGISLNSGNFVVSPMGYAMFANILGSGIGNYELGFSFGKLAIDLVDKFDLGFIKCNVYLIFAIMIAHWKYHVAKNHDLLVQAYQDGISKGNFQFASYSLNHYNFQKFLMRKNLSEVILEYEKKSLELKKLGEIDAFLIYNLYYQFTLNFVTIENGNLTQLKGEIFDEDATLSDWVNSKNSTTLYAYYTCKLTLHFFFGSLLEAYNYAREGQLYESGCFGMMFVPEHNFFDSLTCLLLLDSVDVDKVKLLKQITKNQERMKVWAENCPANYGHKYYIVEAGIANYEGNSNKAIEFYDKAILLAKEHEYLLEEALANEFSAKIWMDKGKERFSSVHLKEAHYLYKKWGCEPKVKLLEEKYPQLIINFSRNNDLTSEKKSTSVHNLDIHTFLKTSLTISGEIHLEKLLGKLMQILIENAGAEKGFFLLKEKENWVIQAESNSNKIEVLKSKSLEDSPDLSVSIVNYVIRTKYLVLLDDATKIGMFTKDTYVKHKKPKSILCYPILYRSEILGVVYLENNLSPYIFTKERVEVLQILSSQIAISIENSLLYTEMENKVIERTAQVNEMLTQLGNLYADSENKRKEIEVLAESRKKLSLVGQMAAGIVHDIKNPMAVIKYLAESLRKQNITETKKEENLNLILREMDRLTDLTYEILDFSKGHLNLELQEIDLSEFLIDIKNFLSIDFEYQGVNCILDLQYTGSIRLDKDRMRRVLINISKNALEAMYDGKNKYNLIIRTSRFENNIILSLIDNGPGLPTSVQKNMFQAFTTEGKTKGTGLGLFMCKWIVNAHGGDITYETKSGEGTSFYISIPI